MDLLMFLVLVLVPIFLLFLLQKHKTRRRNVKLVPPGPKGLPFIGNLHQLDNSNLPFYFWRLSKTYGPLMSLKLGYRQVLVVSSAKMAKEVMKTHDLIFCSRPSFLSQKKLSYNGSDIALSPYNAYWREIRRICIVHLFNSNKVQSFRPIREHHVSSMIRQISEIVFASKPVNLSDQMMLLTSSIMCRVGFGMGIDETGIDRTRFQELFEETENLFTAFFVSDYFPVFGFVDKLTGLSRRLEKNFQDFDRFYEELIKEHLDPKRSKPEEDILDVLLQIRKDGSFKNQLMTFDNIKAVLMDVFLAGTDTSAAVVVWAMTFLIKNPAAMKRAQEEVRNMARKKGFVNEDDIQQLEYLKAVIKETMRLQPPAPLLLPRELSESCKLDGYDIAANTIVHVNVYAIGRDPDVWQNPEEFCPERFIGSYIDLKGQDFELIPFGAGRRICPGIHMGITTVELSLANLLNKFNWKLPDGIKSEDIDMDVKPGLTMHKKNPLSLTPTNYEPEFNLAIEI
ncbi:cytochrome P450 family 71 subfamily B polypeptide 34 [Euphorbia peplus]|nr:cytochrome P450 family 71 subfamily B polypeptide 34 [Euphorbia peplus]